jgi:glycosyltransferase involved in cell wall biosynthesis
MGGSGRDAMSADRGFTQFVRSHDPLVSVVVPAFNKAEHLEETLDSIVAQDWPRREILIIDDGSTDSTPSLVQRLLGQWNRETIRYLRKENGGISDTRNFGIGQGAGGASYRWR